MPNTALPSKISFVDIETTGGSVLYDRVIEVGVIRVEKDDRTQHYQVAEEFKTLIDPGQHLPPEITGLTGITAVELESAPEFGQIKDDLLETLQDSVFVAHNVRFDYGFLKQEYRRFGMDFSPKHFCSVKLSRLLFPKERLHNLDAIMTRFGFSCENRHRALDDARVVWEFFRTVLADQGVERVLEAVNTAMKKPATPIKIPQSQIDDLPELPGVYIFYGEKGMPLYVGKSVNIRERVMSHFTNDHNSSTEMRISQQIESIETVVTSGELGALLKEAVLVKQMQPLYNRALRNSQKLTILKEVVDKEGYKSILTETLENISAEELSSVVGVFRSPKRAKDFLRQVAKEHHLCERRLGVEKTRSGCFSYRLGECYGACVGKEPVVKYNFRFIKAFVDSKIKDWPFDGPILVEEKSLDGEASDTFVIDKWCLIKGGEKTFDLDAYKIIRSFLKSPANLKRVKLLKQDEFNRLADNLSL